jgi:hypothetical protein
VTFAGDGCILDWPTEQNGGKKVAKGEVRCMNGVFDGPGDKIRGPSGKYSGGGFGGITAENPTNVADPPKGTRFDPGPKPTPPVPAGKTRTDKTKADKTAAGSTKAGGREAGKSSDDPSNWQRRALALLAKLQTAKGFKDLPPKVRKEVSALIDDAPDDAYS